DQNTNVKQFVVTKISAGSNPYVVIGDDEEGLTSPPLDKGALIATQTPIEIFKVFSYGFRHLL
ncbi:hypothetical protein TorRG33x02_035570, partial [Trema orientale]